MMLSKSISRPPVKSTVIVIVSSTGTCICALDVPVADVDVVAKVVASAMMGCWVHAQGFAEADVEEVLLAGW